MVQFRDLGFAYLEVARRVQQVEDRRDEAFDVAAAADVSGEGGQITERFPVGAGNDGS